MGINKYLGCVAVIRVNMFGTWYQHNVYFSNTPPKKKFKIKKIITYSIAPTLFNTFSPPSRPLEK